ncbi:hypothetical protein K438DRAFT_1868210, partial [Mycena galopus ATCC 62051]
ALLNVSFMSEKFLWSSPAGYDLARRILEPTPIPYVPHNHQLEGVCKSLDGVHLFAITPTGSGKTSYYILYITIILEVLKNPVLRPSAKFPSNPCLVVVCPTIPLQVEMACQVENMVKLGIKAMAINLETRRLNPDQWSRARTQPNIILTGPEQLKTSEFEKNLAQQVLQ